VLGAGVLALAEGCCARHSRPQLAPSVTTAGHSRAAWAKMVGPLGNGDLRNGKRNGTKAEEEGKKVRETAPQTTGWEKKEGRRCSRRQSRDSAVAPEGDHGGAGGYFLKQECFLKKLRHMERSHRVILKNCSLWKGPH